MSDLPKQHVERYLAQEGDRYQTVFVDGRNRTYVHTPAGWSEVGDVQGSETCSEYIAKWVEGNKARVDEVTRKAEAMLRELSMKPEPASLTPPKAASDVAQARKAIPLATGCLDYFPDALQAVAVVSRVGNEQHNPGKPLHWDRSKSTDDANCLLRHMVDRGTLDTDGLRHSAKVAWRALALLQKEIEQKDKLTD